MTQFIVAQKLINYLRHIHPADEKDNRGSIDTLITLLKPGSCYGLSVSHAVMDYLDKLEWWEEALVAIANSDVTPAALNGEVKLKDATNKQNMAQLMDRVLHYIILCQNILETDSPLPIIDQAELLQPSAHIFTIPKAKAGQKELPEKITRSYLEVLDKNDNTITIKQFSVISGTFTKDQINILLDEKKIENNIFLLNTIDHAIRIGYKNGVWLIYDPNYDHRDAAKIHFTTRIKEDMLNEVIRIQGNSIAASVSSFNDQPVNFAKLEKEIAKDDLQLISGLGLHLLAQHTPKKLLDVIKKLISENKVNELKESLVKSIPLAPNKNWTGLQYLAKNSPDAMHEVFKLASGPPKDPALITVLAKAIPIVTDDNYKFNGIHTIAVFTPGILCPLIRCCDHSQAGLELKSAIIKALPVVDKNNKSGYQYLSERCPQAMRELIHYIPESIPPMLAFTDQTPQGKLITSTLANALSEKVSLTTGFDDLLEYSPEILPSIFDLSTKQDEKENLSLPKSIFSHFGNDDLESTSRLHKLLDKAPNAFNHFLKIATSLNRRSAFTELLAKSLTDTDMQDRTLFDKIAYKAPNFLSDILELVDQSKEGWKLNTAIANAIKHKGYHDKTGLHNIARYAPQVLPRLLGLSTVTAEAKQEDCCIGFFKTPAVNPIKEAFVTALNSVDDKKYSGLETLKKYSPEYLPAIYAFIPEKKEPIIHVKAKRV